MYGGLTKVNRQMSHRYIIILFFTVAFSSCRQGSGDNVRFPAAGQQRYGGSEQIYGQKRQGTDSELY